MTRVGSQRHRKKMCIYIYIYIYIYLGLGMGLKLGLSRKEEKINAENILERRDGNVRAEEREYNKGLEKMTW